MSEKNRKNTDNENTIIFRPPLNENGASPSHDNGKKSQPIHGRQPIDQNTPQRKIQGQYYIPPQQPQYQNHPPQYDPRYAQQQIPPPMPPNAPGKAPKKKRKKKKKSLLRRIIFRVFLTLLIIFILLFGTYSCISLSMIGKLDHVDIGKRTRTSDAISKKYVSSVLIIGTDGRGENDRGRSDSMILVSFNSKSNDIVMTSFMRDCYVDIPGYGMNKLNAAYAWGGPELLMDTIESNFKVKIDNYMSFNFSTFSSIIDAAGGIDIEISDAEAQEINKLLTSEINELMGDDKNDGLLNGGGNVHLTGKQALCYSRIRYVGNSDFERTSRQRRVLEKLMDKAGNSGLKFISKLSKNAIPNITTNMTTKQLYFFSLRLPLSLFYDKKQLQIPIENSYSGETIGGQSVLTLDFDKNRNELKKKVFSEK